MQSIHIVLPVVNDLISATIAAHHSGAHHAKTFSKRSAAPRPSRGVGQRAVRGTSDHGPNHAHARYGSSAAIRDAAGDCLRTRSTSRDVSNASDAWTAYRASSPAGTTRSAVLVAIDDQPDRRRRQLWICSIAIRARFACADDLQRLAISGSLESSTRSIRCRRPPPPAIVANHLGRAACGCGALACAIRRTGQYAFDDDIRHRNSGIGSRGGSI